MEEKAKMMMIMAVLLVLSSVIQSSYGWSSCYCKCAPECQVVKHYDPYNNCFCFCKCGASPGPTPSPPKPPQIPPPQLPPPTQNPPPQLPPPQNPPPQLPPPTHNPPPQQPPPHNPPPQQPPPQNPPTQQPTPPGGDVPPNCPQQPPCLQLSEASELCLNEVSNMVDYNYNDADYIQNCCYTVGQFFKFCGNPFMLSGIPPWLAQLCYL